MSIGYVAGVVVVKGLTDGANLVFQEVEVISIYIFHLVSSRLSFSPFYFHNSLAK